MAEIRRAVPDDWPMLRTVRLRALEADPSAYGSTLERERAYTEDRWRSWPGTAAVFLAVDDRRPIGIAVIRQLTGENADGEINAMWVQPESRGTGIGRQLLDAALGSARAGGYRSVRLRVTSGNLGAITLYERAGFTRTGRDEPLQSDDQLTVHEYLLPIV